MKILRVTDEEILFDNGKSISYFHAQDCCENNYADFSQLEDSALDYDFNEREMGFVFFENAGFRFGDSRKMFFVPCYSEQNGYYTTDIEICYNGRTVCGGEAEFVDR